jgi:hypothetical protein
MDLHSATFPPVISVCQQSFFTPTAVRLPALRTVVPWAGALLQIPTDRPAGEYICSQKHQHSHTPNANIPAYNNMLNVIFVLCHFNPLALDLSIYSLAHHLRKM